MTTSDPAPASGAYVWTWLADDVEPVVAGRLVDDDGVLRFAYGRSYLARRGAVPLYEPDLPLRGGLLPMAPGLTIPGAIRDAAPDAWGRRVILNRTFGVRRDDLNTLDLDELTFLLQSGSDRIGALDFQLSSQVYTARESQSTLQELMDSADRVEKNVPLTPELDQALLHGSSIGGARPKALITSENKKYIAKFSSASDHYAVVKAEFAAMRLAHLAGLQVAPVRIERVGGRDVLLVERFDRSPTARGWSRRLVVSALTVLGLDETLGRYASYEDLAERIRHRFDNPVSTLRELYARIVFNILVGNNDDHARNHAAFWTGTSLRLTPAYDICPQPRSGGEATQAMLLVGQDRFSRIETALAAAPQFHLGEDQAIAEVERQLILIGSRWRDVSHVAGLGPVDRRYLWGRQFLNPYAFTALRPDASHLEALAAACRVESDD